MNRTCLFGAIADDFTGGADLAGMLSQGGVRTLQLFGIRHCPGVLERARDYQAIVVCLKTRSIAAEDACRQSLEALAILQSLGAQQIQFKYCSTFDSTERGNIGPVIEALMRKMSVSSTIAVPALPLNGRTQYMGHLFVGDQLLSDSPMRHHPLNPMTESNLVRFLQKQTGLRVGLIDITALRHCEPQFPAGTEIALVDAITDDDLDRIGAMAIDMKLITGGSGLGMALPKHWSARGWLDQDRVARGEQPIPSGTLILAGSCSAATLQQLRILQESGCPSYRLNVAQLDPGEIQRAMDAVLPHVEAGRAACIRSSAAKEERCDSAQLGEAIEQAFGEIACRVIEHRAATRIIVAGGETSGAVVNALNITAAAITTVIDPGVPALRTLTDPPLHLVLKSGNFGRPDFFLKTIRHWERC